jgi:hypothetical protein
MAEPPYVDEHAVNIAAPPDRVWDALDRYVTAPLCAAEPRLLTRLLGTDPPAGFEVAERVPGERIALAGRHRFSRYRLVFDLDTTRAVPRLRATTYADFPGLHGRAYRALVIGSRLHVLATTRMLRAVRRRALDPRAGGLS